MTITAGKTETKTVTPSTPEGTVLVFIDKETQMTAKPGALAVVGDGTGTDTSRFLDVRWLKGHSGSEIVSGATRTYVQMDGGYYADSFEICEFQVGDRVRVEGALYENGYEGVIASIPATNGDDCIVAVDTPTGRSLSYNFASLVKVEEEIPADLFEDDDCCASYYEEPLAEWEAELLNSDLQPGDIAVLDLPARRLAGDQFDMSEWDNLRFVVGSSDSGLGYELLDGKIDTRPDGYAGSDFYWPKSDVRRFASYDFKVGDLVQDDRFGPAKGIVTRLSGEFGGDIEVNWIEGLDTLVAYGPLGAQRSSLTLIGVWKDETPSDFTFEAGQEIGSSDVLDDLPMGTALIVNGDEASPIIKLGSGSFGRLNRWTGKSQSRQTPLSYFEDALVKTAADGKGVVMIAYVGGESR